MKISVFGLGYVGCVSAGCLAHNGHEVIGVDINEEKVKLINKGKPTVLEKDIGNIIKISWKKKNIFATKDYNKAVKETSISFICVGTPSDKNGNLNLNQIWETSSQIGMSLKDKVEFHTIAIRSTVPPGTNLQVGKIIEELSGRKRNKHFTVVSNPEFLREGTAVEDFYNPSMCILGSDNEYGTTVLEKVYQNINSPILKTTYKIAELLKYVNNSFHALKISFANEIGNICKSMNIDSHELMEIFCMDTRLNISSAYLKPGAPYGGSCLPKDLKALNTIAHDQYLNTPILRAIEKSNIFQKQLLYNRIIDTGKDTIGFIGLAFKKGTDDLRDSPWVELAKQLIGNGINLSIYDEYVRISKLMGANLNYIEKKLPHIGRLLNPSLNVVISTSDVILITRNEPDLLDFKEQLKDKIVIDLVRIKELSGLSNYLGFSW